MHCRTRYGWISVRRQTEWMQRWRQELKLFGAVGLCHLFPFLLPSLSFLCLHSSPPLCPASPPLSLPFPIPYRPPHCHEVAPLNPARVSGEHCKLPQRGLGNRNRIWCILALKSDIMVAIILIIFLRSADQISCSLSSNGNHSP